MICPKCQAEISNIIDSSTRFCPICGQNIEIEVQQYFNEISDEEIIDDEFYEESPNDEDASEEISQNLEEELLKETSVISNNLESEDQNIDISDDQLINNQTIYIDNQNNKKKENEILAKTKHKHKEKPEVTAESVVPVGVWLGSLIGLSIPVVNIVLFIVFVCTNKYRSRRNFFIAAIIYALIMVSIPIFLIIIAALVYAMLADGPASESLQGIIDYIKQLFS